jgi:hypothetical protein
MLSRRFGLLLPASACILISSTAASSPTQPIQGFTTPARFGIVDCTPFQQKEIQAAADEAKRVLIRGGTDAQFRRWFGPKDNTQASLDVQNVVDFVRLFSLESLTNLGAAAREVTMRAVTFDCEGTFFQDDDIAANTSGTTIFINAGFWNLSPNPKVIGPQFSSRASVIIHELSHVAGTGDFADDFGYTGGFLRAHQFGLDLAIFLPSNTIFNADNYEYFYNGK